ncbi:MAG TPA: Fe-S-containing protein [Candidatus Acidoferrales bacterium]
MLSSLVVALREGFEAALVVGIVLSYLGLAQRNDLRRPVWLGLSLAVAASIASAFLLERWLAYQEVVEGWTMLLASMFVASMVYWMWRTAKKLRATIEGRVAAISHRGSTSGLLLLAFVFVMVLREGLETVLIVRAVSLDSSGLATLAGTALGITLAVVFAVLFFRGSLRMDLRKFFTVTSVILLVVAFQMAVSGLHELSEAQVLPSSKQEMAIIGPLVRNDVFFVVAIVLLAAWTLAWELRRPSRAVGAGNPAERRLEISRERRERRWFVSISTLAVLIVLILTADFVYARSQQELSPAVRVNPQGSEIRLPLVEFADGNLHRYAVEAEHTVVRFLVIKKPAAAAGYGVALDACQICGDSGYYQRKGNVICRNCDAVVYTPSIGLTGGCNPVPLKSWTEGHELVVSLQEVVAGASYFRH